MSSPAASAVYPGSTTLGYAGPNNHLPSEDFIYKSFTFAQLISEAKKRRIYASCQMFLNDREYHHLTFAHLLYLDDGEKLLHEGRYDDMSMTQLRHAMDMVGERATSMCSRQRIVNHLRALYEPGYAWTVFPPIYEPGPGSEVSTPLRARGRKRRRESEDSGYQSLRPKGNDPDSNSSKKSDFSFDDGDDRPRKCVDGKKLPYVKKNGIWYRF